MKRLLLFASLCIASNAMSQISYTGGVYSQDFNTLQGTSNNITGVAWTDNTTIAGWYSSHTNYGVTNGTMGGTAATFDGTSVAANVGLFSFGSAASTDRALGSRATSGVAGNTNIYYGVRLVNNTAQTITSFSVMFTGEQWHKNGATTAHTLPVQYLLGATSVSSGTWTSVATFPSPVNTTTIASLDGNAAANRRGVAGKITGISWAPGTELWVRIADGNESGNEQAMAIDDFFFFADDESGVCFNGNSSYVTMGFGATTASLNTSSFTVECRFMRTGPGVTASTGTGGITTALPLVAKGVGEGDGSNLDANYFLGIDNVTGKLVADFEQLNATNNGTAYAAGQNFPVFGSTVLQNGMFYHVAATYDTATAIWKLYVNGVAETTTQTLPTFVGVAPRNDNIQGLGIGTTVNSSGARAGFFHGLIDEARIWNFARSGADILANKDVEIVSAPGLLARYGFDEATGTTTAGTNAAGGAAPVGTLAGTVLPVWVNAKTLVPNIAPTVSITAPATGSSVMFPAPINFAADAADSDGSIVKVEFFNGATKLGEDLTAPYTFAWTNAVVGGPYSITAVATDNGGTPATSAAVTVSVTPNSNMPPAVTLVSPAANATDIGSSVSLNLSIADPESDAQTVTFYGRKTTPVTPGPDFTVATLPDTQFYSENLNNNGRSATYFAQTQWLLDNRNSASMPNLAFISHMGDMVQNGDAIPAEWLVPDGAMKTIENPITALRAYGIPYGVTLGNHDYGTGSGTGTTNGYNQYFGTSRFAGRNYYGGNFGANNNNNYQLFSASGLDFIAISFEYLTGAQSTYQPLLDWADALLKAYPNRRAIITTHWMIDTGNPAAFSAQGQIIYNELKDNPNLFLMLGGHVAGEGRRSDVFEGRTVYSVLQDYQGRTNGGDGWLRYFIFSPANNTITAKTYRVSNPVNPASGTFETDADSEFVLPYNQQSSVTPWIPLGTVNVPASGTVADVSWTGLEKGSDYEWYATSFDGINTATTVSRRFSTVAASDPVVTLTAPATGSTVPLPATIELTADATDADGTVARVEFYQGVTKLGEDTSAPYSYTWSGMSSGTHSLSAVAVDDSNRAMLSNVVSITVTNPGNIAPTVAITAPVDGGTVVANTAMTLVATAGDTDGTVSKVEFFLAATKLGEDLTSPYTFNWAGGPVGAYAFTARATDNDGGITNSSTVNVTAVPAAPFINSYTQNFDGMSTGTAPSSGWQVFGALGGSNTTWENGTGIPASGVGGGTANNTLIVYSAFSSTPSTPSPATSNTQGYNFAETATSTDRALGSSPTTGAGIALQLELTNTGTQAVSAVSVAYDIRRFTTAAANHLPGLQLFYSLDDGFSWTNVSELNPTIAGPTGVIVPATLGVTNVPPTPVTLASPWFVGSTLRFRWIDDNAVATSPDQLSGLDNVAVVATQFVPVIGVAPTVSLTAPAANSTYQFSNAIALTADAADTDGTVTKVEFYRGTTKLGEDTTEPYAYDWTTAPVGSYSLTARATDNDGNLVVSSPRVITVIAGASGTLARGPYLNMGNHHSIVVRWRSSASVIGRVRYGLAPDSLTLSTDEASAQTNHEVKLTGLTPHTRYYYSVGSATDALTPELADTTSVRTAAFTIPTPTAADYTFRTSPVPGTATDTRVWIVGDCGRGSASQAGGRDAYYNWMGNRVPDLNLQLGDNAYNAGTDAEYQTGYWNMYPTIFRKMPQWSTLGNHDANNGNTSPTQNWPYFDMFTFPTAGECGGVASGTEHYYSFDYGNIHFVCLDSQTTLANNSPTAPQTVWLQNDLASTTKTWVIAFFHHPPYSKGSHDSDTEAQMVTMRQIYNPILEAGGVDLVLTGHSHNYERSVLLDGNYGISSTITPSMKRNAGNGSVTGFTTGANGVIRNAANNFTATATVNGAVIPPDGAYLKPLTGPRDHFGTVYNTAGMSGQADGGTLNHSAMYISYNSVGTVNLDINGNTLVASFIQSGGAAPDNYTITKQGAADSDGDGLTDEFEIANGLNRSSAADATSDTDGDSLNAFTEFAFGTNPGLSDLGELQVSGSTIVRRGSPIVSVTSTGSGVDFRALFCRRKNLATAGLTYTVQFSSDLVFWESSNVVTPTVIADDGEMQVVSVRYPFFVGGKKAQFFRVMVTTP